MNNLIHFIDSLRTSDNELLIESIKSGYYLIESADYIHRRLQESTNVLDTILNSDLKQYYVGEYKDGFVFDYSDFYMILNPIDNTHIGKYKIINKKPTIVLYILDNFSSQWCRLAKQDRKSLDKARISIMSSIKKYKSIIIHEWVHKGDDDDGYLRNATNRHIRGIHNKYPDIEIKKKQLNDKLPNGHVAKMTDEHISHLVSALNIDAEFNVMLVASISDAIHSNKTNSFDEFKNAILTHPQFDINKKYIRTEQYNKLLKRIYQYYSKYVMTESVSVHHEYNTRWGMWKLYIEEEGKEIAYLIYSVAPTTTYTTQNGRDPNDYINIEMIYTDEKYRRGGLAKALVNELMHIKADKYPNKQIIATANQNSRSLLSKFGITDVSE